jgi:hypothetical protein
MIGSEIFGFSAVLAGLTGHQQRCPKSALKLLTVGSLLWFFYFAILGYMSAMIISVVSIIRNISGIFLSERAMKVTVTLCLAISALFILNNITAPVHLLPLVAATCFTSAIYLKAVPAVFRVCNMCGELSWLFYGLLLSSAPIIIASALLLSSVIISMIKHDLLQAATIKQNNIR